MKKRTFLFGLASVVSFGVAASESSPTDLELRIDKLSPTGQVTVSLHNSGQALLRLWRTGRWSVGTWRVLHIAAIDGTLTTYYEDPNQIIDDRPMYAEVSQEKPRMRKLDLTGPFWLPRREARSGENIWATGDTLIVIYDIPMSPEAQKLGVWWGVVAAKAIVQ